MSAQPTELRALLAKATPALTNGKPSPKAIEQLLRKGAEHQRPRARDWDQNDYEADAALIAAAVSSVPALLDKIERLEAALKEVHSARLSHDGTDPGYGWSITKLNRAMDAALPLIGREPPALKEQP